MARAKLEGIDLAGVSSMRAREAAWVAGHYVGGETRGLKVKSQKSNPRFSQKAREMGHPAEIGFSRHEHIFQTEN
jgi:hypothetical protein